MAPRKPSASTALSESWLIRVQQTELNLHSDYYVAASLAQSFVGRVKDWSEHPVKSKTLVVVGGGVLLDWLLSKAGSLPSPDQLAAESAICSLLSNGAHLQSSFQT